MNIKRMMLCTLLMHSVTVMSTYKMRCTPLTIGNKGSLPKYLYALLEGAEKSIFVAGYFLTDKKTAYRLADAITERKVQVHVIVDASSVSHGKSHYQKFFKHPKLAALDIPHSVYNGKNLMHNKYVIVDGKVVWIGSANFTPSGLNDHEENVLIAYGRAIARFYKQDFDRIRMKAAKQHIDEAKKIHWYGNNVRTDYQKYQDEKKRGKKKG